VLASSDVRQVGLIFLVSLASVVVLAQVVLAKDRTPRVVLLGSGDHVSVLVVAGDARMLIATGTDGAAFLNAFSSALPFTDRHVDMLVIAGGKADLPVAAAAHSSIDAGRTFVLDGDLTTSLDDLHLDAGALLSGGKKLILSPDLSVSLETAAIPNGDKTIQGWQAIVEHGKTRVRIVSDARLLRAFRDRRSASALVIATKPDAVQLPASFLSLVIPASVSDATPLIPANIDSLPVAKVESGRPLTLRFTSIGLTLPKSARSITRVASQTEGPPQAAIAETIVALGS